MLSFPSNLVRIFLLISFLGIVPLIRGHGRLIEPPSRASAWRYGFKTPPNYNDHELYCGGFSRQYNRNNGKCGICGDPWDLPKPRPHEYGGIYGQGVIVRRYNPASVIIIRVELTANHFGYFQFKLCQNYKNTTQQCLDRHLLKLASSYSSRFNGKLVQDNINGYKFYPRDGNKIYEMRYKLPDVSCNHCVLQWTYTAGNNWGDCQNGTEAVGCGPQETFRACADIKIGQGDIIEPPPTSSEENDVLETTSNAPNDEQNVYDGFKTLVVVGVSLFVVILFISILYTYYYELGKRIKGWLKFDRFKTTTTTAQGYVLPPPPKQPAPVPPPRVRKPSNSSSQPPVVHYNITTNQNKMYTVSVVNESLA